MTAYVRPLNLDVGLLGLMSLVQHFIYQMRMNTSKRVKPAVVETHSTMRSLSHSKTPLIFRHLPERPSAARMLLISRHLLEGPSTVKIPLISRHLPEVARHLPEGYSAVKMPLISRHLPEGSSAVKMPLISRHLPEGHSAVKMPLISRHLPEVARHLLSAVKACLIIVGARPSTSQLW